MRRPLSLPPTLALAALFALIAGAAVAGPLPEFDAAASARPSDAALARSKAAAARADIRRLGRVDATDARYGVPSFVWANRLPAGPPTTGAARLSSRQGSDEAARAYLSDLAPLYRLDRADLAGVELQDLHDTGRGAIIATYRQVVDGIDVFRDEFRVCMDRDLGLVSVSGYVPSRASAPADAGAAFPLPSSHAVALALQDFAGLAAPPAGVVATGTLAGGYESFAPPAAVQGLANGRSVAGGLRARKVWFHLADTLEPAYYVEVMGETAAYSYLYSARDGRLLFRHSLMQDAAFSYRVWAHTSAPQYPMDGPQGDGASPHPTGVPDLYNPSLIAPNLVTLQNGPISTNDPWLAPGATVTTGNNVDAYLDLVSPNGFSAGDVRASLSGPGAFDWTYDVTQNPDASATQQAGAVTTLFYVNNFLHDLFYDRGFDEAAGNAQTDNYGRGGVAGDPILAEGQDYSGTNNANMSTPADGASPRMQMYVFTAPATANLVVSAPAGIAGTYLAGTASFGPQSFSVSGQVVAGQDATAPVDDACSAITTNVAGKIAIVDRGTCTYATKVANAEAAGAIGVILVNNVASSTPPGMGGTGSVTIPVLSVTQDVGAAIRAQLGAGVTATLSRPVQLNRDGTIDGTVISHEWAHYLSNRLVGNASGLTSQQGGGMGEGWSDFVALLMTVRDGDNLAGCFPVGSYALSGNLVASDVYYYGIRRYPYSTDMTKDPLTFRHISNGQALPAGPPINGDPTGVNNAEVHNTGEVWCTMLWECYAALLGDSGRLTFDQARQRMEDYLVAGLKLTPNAPTFVEARDGILAAALANDPADFALMTQAFAKRGMGSGAIAPDRTDATNSGVVESYVVGGDLAVTSMSLTDDLHTCDNDGYLDAGERGTLTIQVANTGWSSLSGTSVTLSSGNTEVSFPGGNVFNLPATTPFSAVALQVPVQLDVSATPGELLGLTADADDPGLLVPGPRSLTFFDVAQVDETPSAADDFEEHAPDWTAGGAVGSAGLPWSRQEVSPGQHQMHVDDNGGLADWWLQTPPIVASPTDPLVLTFEHSYSFEYDATADWDGGVLELSTDGGSSWVDAGGSAVPGYTGTLSTTAGNPLSGRSAWTQVSPGYPSPVAVTVDLGTAYAGQTIRLRFREGSDVAVGAPGWWVDNVQVTGATSPPFIGLTAETGTCSPLAVDDAPPSSVLLAMAGGNPAHGEARLRFALPGERRVRLTVHDLAGRLVATLADGVFSPGWHQAAFSRTSDGSAPGAGVYFARLEVDGEQYTQRVVVVR